MPGKLGCWQAGRLRPGGGEYAGDYVFITETAELQGEPVFVDEVTVFARPVRNPLRLAWIRLRYRARLRSRLRR